MSLKKYSTKNLCRFNILQSFSACRRVSKFLSIRNFRRFDKTRIRVRVFASDPTMSSTPAFLQMMKRILAVVARTTQFLLSGPLEQTARTEWLTQILIAILSSAKFASFWINRFGSDDLHNRRSTISSNSGRFVLLAMTKKSPAVWHAVRHKLERGDLKKSISFRLMIGMNFCPASLSQLMPPANFTNCCKPLVQISLETKKILNLFLRRMNNLTSRNPEACRWCCWFSCRYFRASPNCYPSRDQKICQSVASSAVSRPRRRGAHPDRSSLSLKMGHVAVRTLLEVAAAFCMRTLACTLFGLA